MPDARPAARPVSRTPAATTAGPGPARRRTGRTASAPYLPPYPFRTAGLRDFRTPGLQGLSTSRIDGAFPESSHSPDTGQITFIWKPPGAWGRLQDKNGGCANGPRNSWQRGHHGLATLHPFPADGTFWHKQPHGSVIVCPYALKQLPCINLRAWRFKFVCVRNLFTTMSVSDEGSTNSIRSGWRQHESFPTLPIQLCGCSLTSHDRLQFQNQAQF